MMLRPDKSRSVTHFSRRRFLLAGAAAGASLPFANREAEAAGRFALYEKPDEIAKPVGDFLGRTLSQPAELEQ